MEKLNLEIGNIQYKLLKKYAEVNKLTVEQYSANIIMSWVNSHVEGHFIKKIKEKTQEELIDFLGEPEP
ncbi:hypothetical protein KKF61_08355 [Patescibacteria group bacterium]|nr:hypothetical protein [Patescibacteria group bacterium]